MNCNNTVSDGFYFWIGKALAELSIGFAFLTCASIAFAVFYWWTGRKK